MPQAPTYTFHLPSLHDNTRLDCRLYHPPSLKLPHPLNDQENKRLKGAVIAHPYAPFGGSYDDPVVLFTAETLLEEGFVVATFNFRGAGGSQNHTSWTGKPETDDFASVAGFLVFYLQYLLPEKSTPTPSLNSNSNTQEESPQTHSSNPGTDNETSSTPATPLTPRKLRMLLAGYSYGTLVLARLPALQTVLERFQHAAAGTAAREMLFRAGILAAQTLETTRNLRRESGRESLRPADDTVAAAATPSFESEFDIGIDGKAEIDNDDDDCPSTAAAAAAATTTAAAAADDPHTPANNPLPPLSTTYLLISPVLFPFPFPATLLPPGPPFARTNLNLNLHNLTTTSAGQMPTFLHHTTLAIFGSGDGFTARKRLRTWAARMEARSEGEGAFEWREVEGSGHFWREEGVMGELVRGVRGWVRRGGD